MPWQYRDFAAMRLEDIVGYRYVVETVCLSVEDGQFRREVMGRTATDVIPVVAAAPVGSTGAEVGDHE